MSNSLPPIVGIDIGKESSTIQIIDSLNKPYGKPIEMRHKHKEMLKVLERVQKIEKELGHKPIIVMEATGHYFRIVFYLFHNAGFKVVVVNPIQTQALKNLAKIRRAKTDKIDARDIALLYRLGTLVPTKVPTQKRVELKGRCRDYWNFKDQATSWKIKFTAIRDQIFLWYEKAFDDPFGPTALKIFLDYPTSLAIKRAKKKTIIAKLAKYSRRSQNWAEEKAELLYKLADETPTIPGDKKEYVNKLKSYARAIVALEQEATRVKHEIEIMIKEDPELRLLLTIPGVGPITGATILAELGESSWFKKAKEIVAFAGIDPKVFESGKFRASRVRISKHGSPYLRRVFYIIVITAIFPKRNGVIPNPNLASYYKKLIARGKPPKVAIVACMRKLAHYIFSVLKNRKPFEVKFMESKPQDSKKPFPVYDERGKVVSYAMDAVRVSEIIPSVMQKITHV